MTVNWDYQYKQEKVMTLIGETGTFLNGNWRTMSPLLVLEKQEVQTEN